MGTSTVLSGAEMRIIIMSPEEFEGLQKMKSAHLGLCQISTAITIAMLSQVVRNEMGNGHLYVLQDQTRNPFRATELLFAIGVP